MYPHPSLFLFAFGTCLALLWAKGSDAQQAPPLEWFDGPSIQNDEQLRLDNSRPTQRRRATIRDASPQFRPPITSPNRPVQGRWRLGVHADKTDTGMLITSVVRGSAGDRARLERGDRILAVGTERVGFVGNRGVSMPKVLNRQADFQGNVLLLVQSRRNRGLINVSIRLDRVGGAQFFDN
jgi:hypothetical protein